MNEPLRWYKTDLKNYYYRPEWEMFDLKYDPEELNNIAQKKSLQVSINGFIKWDMKLIILAWVFTANIWRAQRKTYGLAEKN